MLLLEAINWVYELLKLKFTEILYLDSKKLM